MGTDVLLHQHSTAEGDCLMIAFPLASRVGKIRDVAGKLSQKRTDRASDHYRFQIEDALRAWLTRCGISDDIQNREVALFWQAVVCEIERKRKEGCP